MSRTSARTACSRCASSKLQGLALDGLLASYLPTMVLHAALSARTVPWWDLTWTGGTGVAAIGQVLAAAGTLGALIFFFVQLRQARRQARKDAAGQQAQLAVMQEELKLARKRADREVGRQSLRTGVIATFVVFGLIQMATALWKRSTKRR